MSLCPIDEALLDETCSVRRLATPPHGLYGSPP